MDKNKICEAMYALPGSVVVRRRKSVIAPVILILAGVAVIVFNNIYKADLSINATSSLVFVGWSLAIAGAAWLAFVVMSSKGIPFHSNTKSKLRYEELYFDRSLRHDMLAAIAEGDIVKLLGLKQNDIPALTVVVYRAVDSSFVAMQAFEYLDLEYKPLSDLKIVDRT